MWDRLQESFFPWCEKRFQTISELWQEKVSFTTLDYSEGFFFSFEPSFLWDLLNFFPESCSFYTICPNLMYVTKQRFMTFKTGCQMTELKQSPWPATERRSRLRVGALVSPGTKSAWICVVTRPVGKTDNVQYQNIIFSNTSACCSSRYSALPVHTHTV